MQSTQVKLMHTAFQELTPSQCVLLKTNLTSRAGVLVLSAGRSEAMGGDSMHDMHQ